MNDDNQAGSPLSSVPPPVPPSPSTPTVPPSQPPKPSKSVTPLILSAVGAAVGVSLGKYLGPALLFAFIVVGVFYWAGLKGIELLMKHRTSIPGWVNVLAWLTVIGWLFPIAGGVMSGISQACYHASGKRRYQIIAIAGFLATLANSTLGAYLSLHR